MQVAFRGKRFITDVTLEGPLSSVGIYMTAIRDYFIEPFATT